MTSGNYCDIASPIRPSVDDTLTDGSKRQILANNETYAKVCGRGN